MRTLLLAALLGILATCGGGARAVAPASSRPEISRLAPGDDPHRKLTADECAASYDFLEHKGWLAEPGAPRDRVVAGCLEVGATAAFHECIFASQSREDADRCQ